MSVSVGTFLILTFLSKTQTKFLASGETSRLNLNQELYLKELISNYRNYSFTIHYDVANADLSELVLRIINEKGPKLVAVNNVDFNKLRFNRSGYTIKTVNLVMLENQKKFLNFSDSISNFKFVDVVIFITTTTSTDPDILWKMQYLKNAGNVLILNCAENFVKLYKICYYCGNRSRKFRNLQTTNGSKIFVKNKHLQASTFTNMNGHFFLVGYLNYFPYFSCTNSKPQLELEDGNVTIICEKGAGLEGELLHEISRRLNFTYKLVNFGDSSPQSFFDVFEKVVDGTLDFAVGGITRTRDRTKRALFTATIEKEDYNIFYIYRIPRKNQILNALYPFKYTLWIAIIVSIIFLSAGMYVYIRAKRFGHRPADFFDYFSMFYKSILEETVTSGLNMLGNKNWFRILWIFWCFYSMLLSNIYSSKMASFMVRPPHKEPNTLNDVLDAGYKMVIETAGADNILGILENNDATTQILKSRLIFINGWCEAARYVLENPAALITQFNVIQYNAYLRCTDLFGPRRQFTDYKVNDLRISKQYLISTPLGWPLSKGVPYRSAFNKIITLSRQAGLLKKWASDIIPTTAEFRQYLIQYATDNQPVETGNKQMTISDCVSAFVILIVGNLSAVICFIIEVLFANYYKAILIHSTPSRRK